MEMTFVVIGCPRSGTSLLAGILYHLGVNMGDRLRVPDEYNPKGYFEDLDMLKVNHSLYTKAGGMDWTDDFKVSMEKMHQLGGEYIKIMKGIVGKRNERPVWGTKSGMNFTLDLWWPHLRNPKVLAIRRDRDSVVKSIVRVKSGIDQELARRIYDYYTERVNCLGKKYPIDLFDYGQIIGNPRKAVMQIKNRYGLVGNAEEAIKFIGK